MKSMIQLLAVALLSMLVLLPGAGCGRGGGSDPASRSKLFQSPPEVKAGWDAVVTAAKAKQYSTAILGIQKLRQQPGLTPEQTQVMDQTATALSDEMYEAANKGDANAKKSLDDLRKATAR